MSGKSRTVATVGATLRQVAKVLNQPAFIRSRGSAKLLAFLSERLANRGGSPATQAELAKVLGLADDFDPVRNPLVRIHVSKLRRLLQKYARIDGANDPVVLEIPRNCYQLRGYCQRVHDPDSQAANARAAGALAGRNVVAVVEFGGPDGPASLVGRDLSHWLVLHMMESERFATIGPIVGNRNDGSGPVPTFFLQRFRVPYCVTGEITPGHRGVEVSVRLIDLAAGEIFWTDCLTDDSPPNADVPDTALRRFAERIAERLESTSFASVDGDIASSAGIDGEAD
jgi:hypothetical protein